VGAPSASSVECDSAVGRCSVHLPPLLVEAEQALIGSRLLALVFDVTSASAVASIHAVCSVVTAVGAGVGATL
jgi:hypothetical protein